VGLSLLCPFYEYVGEARQDFALKDAFQRRESQWGSEAAPLRWILIDVCAQKGPKALV